MDAVLNAVLGAAPELGGALALVIVVVLLIRREMQTTERHNTEMARLAAQYEKELAAEQAENVRLRAQRDAAEQATDVERAARRAAQEYGSGRHRYRDEAS